MTDSDSAAYPDSLVFSFRDDYFNFNLLQIFFNGIYSVVFFVALYGMVLKRKTNKPLMVVIILMYILATLQTGIDWANLRYAFVTRGTSPIDTFNALLEESYLWTVAPATMLVTNTFLADCVLIFRCFAVWAHDWRVVVLPILSTLSGTTLGVLAVVQTGTYISSGGNPNSFVDYAIPYIAMCLVTTLLATSLIVFRILWLTRARDQNGARNGNGAFSGYRVVIEMVVESALLYAINLSIYLALLFGPDTSNSDGYAQAVLIQMTGIAPTLIVARVSFGLARPSSSWQRTSTSKRSGASGSTSMSSSKTWFSSRWHSKRMQFSGNEDLASSSLTSTSRSASELKEWV
uniref:Uncharacterized protein n=1 Tax=Mycena chlorophos TaxID=658473 RepID=A0ABQ0KWI1_MYCCL|nr:predicted protein [Mycena chlorophos]